MGGDPRVKNGWDDAFEAQTFVRVRVDYFEKVVLIAWHVGQMYMIRNHDKINSRIALSLEPEPGHICSRILVTARKDHERIEAEGSPRDERSRGRGLGRPWCWRNG